MLTDADGLVLNRMSGDSPLLRALDKVHLAPGFGYAERTVGTNGLGLAISARIIAEHGGHIGYRCPPDGGTVFSITLQQARAARPAEHAA